MSNNDYANEPNQSRSEDIIQSILDNTEYDEAARSRIEYLLIELKNAIEGGGGGGGVTSYSPLTEKPKIDNHTLQAGNNTSSDLGLQTKLTFDSVPTESSTNPVTSGGVYTVLDTKANSSDVYNKLAVDTALGAKADKSITYTKTEVDTALSSKQNTISDLSTIRSGAALGATAVQPVSGKGLSTNDYTNDEKSKLAGIEAQANKTTVDSALSGTSTNPVQNKVVKSALDGKQASLITAQLEAVNSGITAADVEQITTNKNNILLIEQMNGAKNKLNFEAWKNCGVFNGTKTVNGNSFTLVASGEDCFTYYENSGQRQYPINARIPCNAGDKVVLTWEYTPLSSQSDDRVGIFANGSTSTGFFALVSASNKKLEFTAPTGATYLSIRFGVRTSGNSATYGNIQIQSKASYDAGFTDYQPYALSNAELTAKEQVNKNNILLLTPALKECMDNGAKNRLPATSTTTSTTNGLTLVVNSDYSITITGTMTKVENTDIYFIGSWTNTSPFANYTGKNMRIYCKSSTSIAGQFKMFDRTASKGYAVAINNNEGANISGNLTAAYFTIAATANAINVTLYPMICEPSLYIVSQQYVPPAMSNAELTKLSKWNYTETRYTNTGTSDYENTGISFTAPANQSIEFYAYDRKDGAYLDKILVCDSLTTLGNTTIVSANSIIDGFTDAQYWTLQTTGIVPTFNTDVTYYVWVKRKSTGSNLVGLAWRYLSQ